MAHKPRQSQRVKQAMKGNVKKSKGQGYIHTRKKDSGMRSKPKKLSRRKS